MYAVRGIAVSFSIFFILYGTLSLGVCVVWQRVWRYGQQRSARGCANLLFGLRMAPLLVAIGITLVLAVPSFLMLEPRAVEEPLGFVPVALGFCGMGVILAGIWNAVLALVRVSKTIAQWSIEARVVDYRAGDLGESVSIRRTSALAPPLTAVGIFRPSVWLSGAAEFVLTERELKGALRHEVVHVRRRDNLRKLLLRLVAFPGMANLESAWREATEMAADDAAVSSAREALDLAAAVIKLSRLFPQQPEVELTTPLVHSPAESVNARVTRLVAWTERPQTPVSVYSWRHALCAAATLATLAVTYSGLLVRVHELTEWLVR
jgi:beta-lactamase regulating signal transducer with metallopeptidase domain